FHILFLCDSENLFSCRITHNLLSLSFPADCNKNKKSALLTDIPSEERLCSCRYYSNHIFFCQHSFWECAVFFWENVRYFSPYSRSEVRISHQGFVHRSGGFPSFPDCPYHQG